LISSLKGEIQANEKTVLYIKVVKNTTPQTVESRPSVEEGQGRDQSRGNMNNSSFE